jgi:hypothetical protein
MTNAGMTTLLLLGVLASYFLEGLLLVFLLSLLLAWLLHWGGAPSEPPRQDKPQATSLYVPTPNDQPSRTNAFTEASDAYLDNLERVLGDK